MSPPGNPKNPRMVSTLNDAGPEGAHKCQYAAVEAPGDGVLPLIVSPGFARSYPSIDLVARHLRLMQRTTLYQCRICREYVYVSAKAELLRLIAPLPPPR